MSESLTLSHPISALLELINKLPLTANLLISPGDLGDKADMKGIKYSWAALERLSVALGCTLYTATAGNHDVDSRLNDNDHNPLHILKGLVPSFPLQNETLDDRYWSRGYAIYEESSFRLVVLNSSSLHGYAIEKDHGRIDEFTLDRLTKDLAKLKRMPINILLCHHHPHHHSELSLGEADVMKLGQQLLDMLGSGKHGQWIVVHGHKHHPKIAYAAGGSTSPVVFAAGSLCAILTGALGAAARNQFYVMEIDADECELYGLVGRIRAWDWYPGLGWTEANATGSGLPAEFGFGHRAPIDVAKQIHEIVAASRDTVSWRAICDRVPTVNFLLPQDLAELTRLLTEKYSCRVEADAKTIVEVGRLVK